MMAWPRVASAEVRRGVRWREWLLLVVSLSLAASLATRYVHVSSVETVTTVKAGSPDTHRQRLQKNTFQWTPPVAEFTIFVLSITPYHPAPIQPLLVVHLEEPLYNRPPPSC